MNTQKIDPIPNRHVASDHATSEPSAEAGAKLSEINLWHLRRETRKAEAKRKGRSIKSDQSTESDPMPRDPALPLVKPSSEEVVGIDWAKLNKEAARKGNPNQSERDRYLLDRSVARRAAVKFEDGWVFGLDNIEARWKQGVRWGAKPAAVTYQEKQTRDLNLTKKRPVDELEASEDDDPSTKRQRVESHATFGYPGVFSSSYKGDTDPKAPETGYSAVQQHDKSTFRSLFGTPAAIKETSSSASISQEQSLFGHIPPRPAAEPEPSSLFGPVPTKPSAKLEQSSLFGFNNQTRRFSKEPPTTSGLFGFNDITPADSIVVQASEDATTKPRPTSSLFSFIDATPVDSLAVQASEGAINKPPPTSGLFGVNNTTPDNNDSLAVQASTYATTYPQDHAPSGKLDMDAYLSMPNLFGRPPQDNPTKTKATNVPTPKPIKPVPVSGSNQQPTKAQSTFTMGTMQERFFESADANEILHPLDEPPNETGAPLDLESYLPPQFPRYYETRHLNETSLFLSRAKYFISLGGPPLRDMTYGIVVVPFGEERLLLCGHSITHGCDKCEPGRDENNATVEKENGDNAAEKELEESRLLREVVEDHKAKKKWWKGDPSWDRNARMEYLDEDCKEGEGNAEKQVIEGLGDKVNA
ncbi:hypothetical protein V8F06_012581 [Rhypophila decipiens]